MGMKFKDKIAMQGCKEGYCEHNPGTGIPRWVYDVLGESHPTHFSGPTGSKANSHFDGP